MFTRPARYSRRNKLVNNHLRHVSSHQFARSTDICKTHRIFQEHNFHVNLEKMAQFFIRVGEASPGVSLHFADSRLRQPQLTGLHFQIASLHLFSFFRCCAPHGKNQLTIHGVPQGSFSCTFTFRNTHFIINCFPFP